jgi:hypothetical protein
MEPNGSLLRWQEPDISPYPAQAPHALTLKYSALFAHRVLVHITQVSQQTAIYDPQQYEC